ncbi:RadC family protein [Spongorhabdus nitratireducens]
MSISDWPETERPREKLLNKGAGSLSDAELLAIFLRTGTAGFSAVDLARELLTHFGSLRKLFDANLNTFSQVKGMGQAKYCQLHATLELARRHLAETMEQQDALTSPKLTRQYLQLHLRDYKKEVFACLFLDNRHRVIAFDILFQGTINSATVYPREVVKSALHRNAAALILAHNHPSGNPEPSQADIRLTERLKEALALVDIRVLDHMIVGDGQTVSLAERGLM